MEIKLFEAADKKKSFTFSSLPEKISGSLGTKYQTYDIISQGAVKVPKGTEVAEISWDAVFFGPDRKNLAVVKAESYQKPDMAVSPTPSRTSCRPPRRPAGERSRQRCTTGR